MQTVKQKMVKFQRTVVEPEFKKAISDGIVEEIYWVVVNHLCMIYIGGIKEMVNGSAKNCHLRYNSNPSRTSFKVGVV